MNAVRKQYALNDNIREAASFVFPRHSVFTEVEGTSN